MKEIINFSIITIITLTTTAAAHAADLNKDNAATIARDCRGIGPAIAARITDSREKDGPFTDYVDLQKRIRGIGEKKRADIEKQKTCNLQTQNQTQTQTQTQTQN